MDLIYSLIWLIPVFLLLEFICLAYPHYIMFKRANLKRPWAAFIPIYGKIKMYNLANISMWWVFGLFAVSLIPVVGPIAAAVFFMYIHWKIVENFGVGIVGCIISCFVALFVFWYIVLTKKEFQKILNHDYTVYNSKRIY